MNTSKKTALVILACHAAFKNSTACPLTTDCSDENLWVLQPYQKGEVQFYLEHIRISLELLKANPNSALMFSGGFTREESGNWSEARTYLECAKNILQRESASNQDVKNIFLEEYARDSFENLLFGICNFRIIFGYYPYKIYVVSWKFKKERFDFHRKVLQIPENKFSFIGSGNPENLSAALQGEKKALKLFKEDFYGNSGELMAKKLSRDIKKRTIPYFSIPELLDFFNLITYPKNKKTFFKGTLPWIQQEH